MEGNLQEANCYLARAVKLNPQDPASRRNLAANQWQLGRLKEAHGNLDLLLRANPQDQGAIYLLGMVLEKEKAYARSAKLLESVPEVMAHQPDGWVALADSYYHTGRPENARAALQHLLTTSQEPRIAFLGGRVAADAKDYPTAENLFRSVRSSYPDRSAVEFQLARAEYQAGHVTESEKTLLDAVNANYSWDAGKSLTIGFQGDYTRTATLQGTGVTSGEVAGAQAGWRMGRYLSVFANYTVLDQSSSAALQGSALGSLYQTISFGIGFSPRKLRPFSQ